MDAITFPPAPTNEPNLTYAPGTPERDALAAEILRLEGEQRSLDTYVGGEWKPGGGTEIPVVQPHDHQHVLGMPAHAVPTPPSARPRGAHPAAAPVRRSRAVTRRRR